LFTRVCGRDTQAWLKTGASDLGATILLWTGNFGTGSSVPAVRARGVIPRSAQSVAELLMDSAKVKTYHAMSLGRTDVRVYQKGIGASSREYGVGETKIVRNRTQPPLTKKTLTFTTLMHARELENGTVLVVLVISRAVNDLDGAREGEVKSEILLGVNVLRPISSHECELTSVTHVQWPLVPEYLAKSMGVKGARDFIRTLTKMEVKRE